MACPQGAATGLERSRKIGHERGMPCLYKRSMDGYAAAVTAKENGGNGEKQKSAIM